MGGAWQEFEERSRNRTDSVLAVGALIAFAVLAALRFLGGGLRSEDTAPEAASSGRGGGQSYVGV